MDILFVNAQESMELRSEVNGQLLLGTMLLQAGFDVDILRFCQIEGFKGDYVTFVQNAVQSIVQTAPKAVCFYSLWPEYHIVLRIARQLKAVRKDIHVILGGPQPSATARETMQAMPFVDAICTGEGEMTVVPFFTALLRNGGAGLDQIPGLYYRDGGVVVHNELEHPLCDLNALPHWDDRLYRKHYPAKERSWSSPTFFMPIDAGRGCPYRCTFCCSSTFWRRTYRMKSSERIMEDIRFFYQKFGIRSFWFSHDAFTVNMELVEEICDRIIDEGLDITWKCATRVDRIDRDLILKMKRAGLTRIEMGIETGSQRMQKLINKNLKLDMVRENVRFLVEQGIETIAFFIHGFPDETEQELVDTLELALDLLDAGIYDASMNFCRFNPTTVMTQQFFQQLKLNPALDVLNRSIYGYENELDAISGHKALFPYYYHVENELGERYQYLRYFIHTLKTFSLSRPYIRKAFGGDTAALVRAFFDANPEAFTNGIEVASHWARYRPQQLLYNMLDRLERPEVKQLKALVKFEFDRNTVFRAKEDCTVINEYDFCYTDLKQRRPLAEFREGTSTLLLQKKAGKFSVMMLKN
ncbi:MAG: B12-binding domain-containing radical SAM protein [Oscillospiraceae bacterium]|nr:B12-binding domain-containing radical SAM protein [Oscillospiraceae bacterium]